MFKALLIGRGRRKGVSAPLSLVMMLILMIIFAVIFIRHEYQLKRDSEGIIKKEICRNSVFENSKRLRLAGTDLSDAFGNVVEIKCSTDYKEIGQTSDDKIKSEIADMMYDCYDQYWQGTLPIFDVEDEAYCVICSELTFGKKTTLHDFSGFLMSERIPSLTRNQTYFEYFYGSSGSDRGFEQKPDPSMADYDMISTENPLAVVFVMAKEGYMGKPASAYIGGGIGLAAGFVLTATGVFAEIGIPLTISSVGLISLGGGTAGTAIGYVVGSPTSTAWDAGIMLTPVENKNFINCTFLEGKASEGLKVYKHD
ncbi:hypothetical protein JW968_05375 [Candidatus Woesearchaeota archaeon]|nr:hypothetical protein [Candidatus Woesearchaeota archaeon]